MKNYTSIVTPERSIAEIERLLIKHGAKSIAKEYGAGGSVSAISFVLTNPETQLPVSIRLPADPEAVFKAFKVARKTSFLSEQQAKALRDQAAPETPYVLQRRPQRGIVARKDQFLSIAMLKQALRELGEDLID